MHVQDQPNHLFMCRPASANQAVIELLQEYGQASVWRGKAT